MQEEPRKICRRVITNPRLNTMPLWQFGAEQRLTGSSELTNGAVALEPRNGTFISHVQTVDVGREGQRKVSQRVG